MYYKKGMKHDSIGMDFEETEDVLAQLEENVDYYQIVREE